MAKNWKALAIGIVGAIGGLGAVSLSAQDGASQNEDVIIRSGTDGVWHASQGRLRHCTYDRPSGTMFCTSWR